MSNKGPILITVVIIVIAVTIYLNQINYADSEYTWHVSNNESNIVRGQKIDKIKEDMAKLIYALNKTSKVSTMIGIQRKTEQPRLKLITIEKDTVSVEVINGDYLTRRMGSAGAQSYLAEATFTLTEYKGINNVDFKFTPGDHAMPGIYTRQDFSNYKIVKK